METETIKTTRVVKQPVEINASEFTNDVNNGMTYILLSQKYNLPIKNIKDVAKELNIQDKVKRHIQPKYILVNNNTNNALNK